MSATINDYFNKASSMSGEYPKVATVSAARSSGGNILACDDLSGWATDTAVHFSTFQVDAEGNVVSGTQTDWKGVVVDNTITEMTRLAGAADSGNTSGDRVELNPTIGWLDDLITGLLVSHKQNGALKDSIVTTDTLAAMAVTNAKLASNAVNTAKLTDGAVTADKVDFTTFGTKQVTIDADIVLEDGVETEILSTRIEHTGIYLVAAQADVDNVSAAVAGYTTAIVELGDDKISSLTGAYTNNRTQAIVTGLMTASAGDACVFKILSRGATDATVRAERTRLIVVRVG